MISWSIHLAAQEDYREIVSCFVSSSDALPANSRMEDERTDDLLQRLSEDIEEHRVLVVKSRKTVLAFAIIAHSLEDEFFPKTHSYRKSSDILEDAGHRGEPLLILRALFVLPVYQRQGLGAELLKSLFATHKGTTWLLFVEEENQAAMTFFKDHGFFPCGNPDGLEWGEKKKTILAKRFRPTGLCREAYW